MCWVMPPASPAATCVLRIRSSRLVLPWSTCPSIAATMGRFLRFARSRRSNSFCTSSSREAFRSTISSVSNSRATNSAMSLLMDWLAVAMTPCFMSLPMMSVALTARAADRSLTRIGSLRTMLLGRAGAAFSRADFEAIRRVGRRRKPSPPAAVRRACLSSISLCRQFLCSLLFLAASSSASSLRRPWVRSLVVRAFTPFLSAASDPAGLAAVP